jgi:hypothetical protein
MFHITIAIARFFEILLLDIARSLAGVIAVALAAAGIILVLCRWIRRRGGGRSDGE